MHYLIQAGASLAAAIVLAACGGGGESLPSAQAAVLPAPDAAQAAPARVTIEGCVDGAGAHGVPVRATDRDGRLLGDARSDAGGVFRLSVSPGQEVRLASEADPDGALTLRVGAHPVSIGGCLRTAG